MACILLMLGLSSSQRLRRYREEVAISRAILISGGCFVFRSYRPENRWKRAKL
jgi:hypothetical protein